MFERLLIAAVIIIVGVVSWVAYNRWSLWRAAAKAPTDPLLAGLRKGVPAILYFTTPNCQPCRTLQQPALHALQQKLGPDAIQIIRVDATEQPDAADRWGVFSAPTTFVLDRALRPTQVNRGVASLEVLRRQVQSAIQQQETA